MRSLFAIALTLTPLLAMPAQAEPFAQLRAAYAARDAKAAAAAYASDARVTYRYEGSPVEEHVGTAAIQTSFQALFDQIDPRDRIDLNFRETMREGNRVQGVYRLRLGRAQTSYGRFDVTLAAGGAFATDTSTGASREDFEEAPGPVLLDAADDVLDRDYYAPLTGRYTLPDKCTLIVTRSQVRLFMRNSCTAQWRGLTRLSGREWAAGGTVLAEKATVTVRFAKPVDGASPSIELSGSSGRIVATRLPAYRTEDVEFRAGDGTRIAGTLYLPQGNAERRAATVMLHGSGPQDRDGYASIIAVLADEMAAADRIVLAYDKRGSGGSEGDGDRAGFPTLSADAAAALAYLRGRPDVDPARTGVAGSSQAGWVAAKLVESGAAPADVLLLGAAGAALTVAEQNLSNTKVRMQCLGLKPRDIRLALAQQRAFFAFLRNPAEAGTLDALTAQARQRGGLTDWLFPDSASTDRSAAAWYVVLDPSFDPLPVWRRYEGNALFLFSEHDDATPTDLVMARLAGTRIRTVLLPGAQHLGLIAKDRCSGDLGGLDRFAPELMRAISAFAASVAPGGSGS